MLRRRPDQIFEYREIELALYAASPQPLASDRREVLRARVLSSLGAQDQRRMAFGLVTQERWIAIPVGAGIAATLIAGTSYILQQVDTTQDSTLVATAAGSVTVDGQPSSSAASGELVKASSPSWIAVGEHVRVGMKAGAAMRFHESDGRFALFLESGTHQIASSETVLEIHGELWTARVAGSTVIEVSIGQWMTSIDALEGEAVIDYAGERRLLRADDPPVLLMNLPSGGDLTGLEPAAPAGGIPGSPADGGGDPGPGDSAVSASPAENPEPPAGDPPVVPPAPDPVVAEPAEPAPTAAGEVEEEAQVSAPHVAEEEDEVFPAGDPEAPVTPLEPPAPPAESGPGDTPPAETSDETLEEGEQADQPVDVPPTPPIAGGDGGGETNPQAPEGPGNSSNAPGKQVDPLADGGPGQAPDGPGLGPVNAGGNSSDNRTVPPAAGGPGNSNATVVDALARATHSPRKPYRDSLETVEPSDTEAEPVSEADPPPPAPTALPEGDELSAGEADEDKEGDEHPSANGSKAGDEHPSANARGGKDGDEHPSANSNGKDGEDHPSANASGGKDADANNNGNKGDEDNPADGKAGGNNGNAGGNGAVAGNAGGNGKGLAK